MEEDLREDLAEGIRRRERREAFERDPRADELLEAVCEENIDTVRRLLREGVNPNAAEESGEAAAIHYAAMGKSPEVMTLLLEAGANPDVPDEDGAYPLHLAAPGGYVECVRVLLAAGADASVQDDDGRTASEVAAGLGQEDALALLS